MSTIYRVQEYRSNATMTEFRWVETNLSACGPADEEKGGFLSAEEAMARGCRAEVKWAKPENNETELIKPRRGRPYRFSVVAVASRIDDQWRIVKFEDL